MDDEEYARKLQEKFDEESKQLEIQCKKDSELAQKIAAKSHNISDSEEESDHNENEDAALIAQSSETGTFTSALPLINKSGISPSGSPKRPVCEYGAKCYRKNPEHIAQFYHPDADSVSKRPTVNEVGTSQSLYHTKPFVERLKLSSPFNFFLNKTFSVPETKKDWLTLVLPDLLHPSLGTLVESAQINFMVELDFIMDFYTELGWGQTPILFMYGEIVGAADEYPTITCCKVTMPFQYGVHHTKMMLLRYKEGLRVVVHTANLIPDDWFEKTQGFWVSPLFPPLAAGTRPSLMEGESKTGFKCDLVEYLLSYKNSHLNRWANSIKEYDFTSCNVYFIGSVPGYHAGESRFRFGHLKCRQILRKSTKWKPGPASPVVIQCSSIGSLGKDARSWLVTELGVSLMGATPNSSCTVNLIYPSEEEVANSAQGYGGGSCLPYHSGTHEKQPWLKNHMHCWRSERRKRSKSMPHIKTYTRLDPKGDRAQYFLLTSSNLSKAAWGQLQKQDTQLFVRSYEAGVLWVPDEVVESESFTLCSNEPKRLNLPYDHPLIPYPDGAVPWFKNTRKAAPDVLGNTYP